MKTVSLNEKLYKEHLIGTKILTKENVKFIFEVFNVKGVSKCRKFALVENKVFDIQNKTFIESDNLLTESSNWEDVYLLLEEDGEKKNRSVLTWWADLGQNLISVGSVVANVFVPGSGLAIEVTNALIYMLRAYYTKNDSDLQNALLLNGVITAGFAIYGAGFGGGASVALKAMISSGKLAAGLAAKGLVFILGKIGLVFKWILNFFTFGASNWVLRQIARFVPALKPPKGLKGAEARKYITQQLGKPLDAIQKRLTDYINKLLKKAAISNLAGKEGFEAFFNEAAKKGTALSIAQGKAAELLAKMNYTAGKAVTINGVKGTIKSIGADGTIFYTVKGATKGSMISATVFLEGVLQTKTFKDYVKLVFGNPSTQALGARFLSGFKFGSNGNIENVDVEKMPKVDIADKIAAENISVDMGAEVAGYEGDTQEYTVKNEVSAIQTALASLGKDLGSTGVDGKYGPITKAAINSVEEELGVAETTGAITAQTVANIASALVKANKKEEAKELAKNAISDAKVKAEVEKMISGSTNYLKNMLNSIIPVSENISKEMSFSEKYKATFGL